MALTFVGLSCSLKEPFINVSSSFDILLYIYSDYILKLFFIFINFLGKFDKIIINNLRIYYHCKIYNMTKQTIYLIAFQT